MARVAPGQFVGGENCFAVRRAYAKNGWERIRFGEGRAPEAPLQRFLPSRFTRRRSWDCMWP